MYRLMNKTLQSVITTQGHQEGSCSNTMHRERGRSDNIISIRRLFLLPSIHTTTPIGLITPGPYELREAMSAFWPQTHSDKGMLSYSGIALVCLVVSRVGIEKTSWVLDFPPILELKCRQKIPFFINTGHGVELFSGSRYGCRRRRVGPVNVQSGVKSNGSLCMKLMPSKLP